nr:MAG TPA: hypothetical protein [Caudoviricetes sp.]
MYSSYQRRSRCEIRTSAVKDRSTAERSNLSYNAFKLVCTYFLNIRNKKASQDGKELITGLTTLFGKEATPKWKQ